MYGGSGSMVNWAMIGIMLCTILIWWSIFTNGFFITVLWGFIAGCIIGIIITIKENTRV